MKPWQQHWQQPPLASQPNRRVNLNWGVAALARKGLSKKKKRNAATESPAGGDVAPTKAAQEIPVGPRVASFPP